MEYYIHINSQKTADSIPIHTVGTIVKNYIIIIVITTIIEKIIMIIAIKCHRLLRPGKDYHRRNVMMMNKQDTPPKKQLKFKW